MRALGLLSFCLVFCCSAAACQQGPTTAAVAEEIIALERAILDRWIKGDPRGYLELFASDVTYFDPSVAARVDGYQAMEELLLPIAGKFSVDRYDMLNPTVTAEGDVAVLTYNLVNYVRGDDNTERVLNRWNSTEVYRRLDGDWKIVHSHWSFTRPELRQTGPEGNQNWHPARLALGSRLTARCTRPAGVARLRFEGARWGASRA